MDFDDIKKKSISSRCSDSNEIYIQTCDEISNNSNGVTQLAIAD